MAEEYFLGRSGNSRTGLVNIFDNLIQRGLCRPFIAVSPTWDKDNRSKDWGESTREAAVFSHEYVNDLIPAVETRYSTYLAEATPEGILASRAHRAIGGFSLGSITTWYVFEQAFAYSRMYLPMSGDTIPHPTRTTSMCGMPWAPRMCALTRPTTRLWLWQSSLTPSTARTSPTT